MDKDEFTRWQQAMDQSIAASLDSLPTLLWGLYYGFKERGFSPAQAFALVQTYLMNFNQGGNRPPEAPKENA